MIRFYRRASQWGGFPYALVSFTYTVAWWPQLLLGDARFWDDWVLDAPYENLALHFSEHGSPWNTPLYHVLNISGPARPTILFLLYLFSILLWYRAASRLPGIDRSTLIISVALISVAPLFEARFSYTQAWSLLGIFFFMLAWNFSLPKSRLNLINFGLANVTLAVAIMLYPAVAPLSLAIALHLIWLSVKSGKTESTLAWAKRPALILASALSITLAKITIFTPSGHYEGYQRIVLSDSLFIVAIITFVASIALIATILSSTRQTGHRLVGLEIGAIGVFGLLALVTAIGPYVAMGDNPPFLEWETRYEVNFFIGLTLIAYSIFRTITLVLFRGKLGWALVLPIAILFYTLASESIQLGLRFERDALKQRTLANLLKSEAGTLEGKFVVVVDETTELNVFGRRYRDYEWSGIFSNTVDESRSTFGVTANSSSDAQQLYEQYLKEGIPRPVYGYSWANHTDGSEGLLVEILFDNSLNPRDSLSGITLEISALTAGEVK